MCLCRMKYRNDSLSRCPASPVLTFCISGQSNTVFPSMRISTTADSSGMIFDGCCLNPYEPVTLYVSEGIGAYMYEFREKPVKYFMGKGPLDRPHGLSSGWRMLMASPGVSMGPVQRNSGLPSRYPCTPSTLSKRIASSSSSDSTDSVITLISTLCAVSASALTKN